MRQLEQYFKGDESWITYSSYFSKFWTDSDFQTKLLGYLDNRIDFAQVIYYHLKGNSISWINSRVPALGDLTPMECLKEEKLINRLKACLMRFRT